jgi:hypothetical protein
LAKRRTKTRIHLPSDSSSDGNSVSVDKSLITFSPQPKYKYNKTKKQRNLASDIELASTSNGKRCKRRKRSTNYQDNLDSGVLSKNGKPKQHHRCVKNAKENTSMVSTRNDKDTSSKGGTVKKAPRKAAVAERALTKEEARNRVALLGKKVSDPLKARKRDEKAHLEALEQKDA